MAHEDFDLDFLAQASDRYFEQLKRVKEARFRLSMRGALMLIGLAVGSFFIIKFSTFAAFCFVDDSAVVDLGDLRSPQFQLAATTGLKTNDRVAFRNDVIMFDELQSEGREGAAYYFYYSPITNFVVRTSRELPPKEVYRIAGTMVEIGPFEATLVAQRKAFPSDVVVSFAGGGRLVVGEDIPPDYRAVLSFMSNSSGVPVEQMKLLLDGEEPSGYHIFLYLIAGASVLMLGTMVFFADALIRYRRELARLARPDRS